MMPPDFQRFYEGKGINRPYCSQCVYFTTEIGTSRGLHVVHYCTKSQKRHACGKELVTK